MCNTFLQILSIFSSLRFAGKCRPWWVLLQHSIMLWLFLLSSVVLCAVSALCTYSKFGHHPHPLGHLCAKFHFFCGIHCWASSWGKIVYSITHSPSLSDAPGTEACASENLTVTSNQCSVTNLEWQQFQHQLSEKDPGRPECWRITLLCRRLLGEVRWLCSFVKLEPS